VLTRVDGQLWDGRPYRMWAIEPAVPGQLDAVVVAAAGGVYEAHRVGTAPGPRARLELQRAIGEAATFTREQRHAHDTTVQERWDRACQAAREA
jgi:hypothetical protein